MSKRKQNDDFITQNVTICQLAAFLTFKFGGLFARLSSESSTFAPKKAQMMGYALKRDSFYG